jgi:hypothetical protein
MLFTEVAKYAVAKGITKEVEMDGAVHLFLANDEVVIYESSGSVVGAKMLYAPVVRVVPASSLGKVRARFPKEILPTGSSIGPADCLRPGFQLREE